MTDRRSLPLLLLGLVAAASGVACQGAAIEDDAASGTAITSIDGTPLELTFQSEVLAAADATPKEAALLQLEYLQGVLMSDAGGNAQFLHAAIDGVEEIREGDAKRITFTARVPVIWKSERPVPETYALALPRDARALAAFAAKYDGTCGAHEYSAESFWHDFDPSAPSCRLDPADVARSIASVRLHPRTTRDKYLELDRVWADNTLDVVAVYGLLGSGSPDPSEREMAIATQAIESELTERTTKELPHGSGVVSASLLTGTKPIFGRVVKISLTTIVVGSLASTGYAFDEVYGPASEKADYIYYSGHAGLGANVRSLASRSRVAVGKYQVAYFNGCQTFGYLGTAWHDRKREANGAAQDPDGTRDLDVFLTSRPAYGDRGVSMLALYRALEALEHPTPIATILESFSSEHLNVVVGEHDNQFQAR